MVRPDRFVPIPVFDGESDGAIFRYRSQRHFSTNSRKGSSMHDHRWTASRRVAMQHGGRPMAQNENGIEDRKSEHVTARVMSRATTLSAVFIV